ncbi:MAG: lectin-like protein [Flavobacteriales bacterium]
MTFNKLLLLLLVLFGFISYQSDAQNCEAPINLTPSNLTDTSVVISWSSPTNSSNILGYRIRYRKIDESFDAWYDSNIPPLENSSLILGLEPGTDYEIALKSVCSFNPNITSVNAFLQLTTPILGCTDPNACNFDPLATGDDGNCEYATDTTFFNVNACDIYAWNNTLYNQTGSYIFNTENCDVEVLNLVLVNNEIFEETINACDSIIWNGNMYTESGTYFNTLTTESGCDSLCQLNLTLLNDTVAITVTSCDSFQWNDSTYTTSGNYTQVFENQFGCDSIVNLELSIFNSYFTSHDIQACGDSYVWNDTSLLFSGTHLLNYSSINGCDSLVEINLLLSNFVSSSNTIICQGDSVTLSSHLGQAGFIEGFSYSGYLNGSHYYLSDNNTTWTEADSIAQFYGAHLVSINSEDENTFVSFFTNDNIWLGLNTANDTEDFEWTSNENIDYFNWNEFEPSGSGDVTLMYGQNDPININTPSVGKWALVNGIINPANNLLCKTVIEFTDIPVWSTGDTSIEVTVSPNVSTTYYSNFSECTDSIVVTVLDTFITNLYASACDSYSWNQTTYTESGVYSFTIPSSNGCDSTIQLNLTIFESDLDTIPVSACNVYEWNDQTLTVSGFYEFSTLNSNGCDSTIILDLTINNDVMTSEIITTCGEFEWEGDIYTENGEYTKTFTDINGCDSTHTLELIVVDNYLITDSVSACDSFIWNGTTYSQSGEYTDTLLSVFDCDSIVTLVLTVNTSYFDSFDVQACGDSYEWNDTSLAVSGTHQLNYSSVSGCDSIVEVNLLLSNFVTSSDNIICQGDSITLSSHLSQPGIIDGFTYSGYLNGSHYYLSDEYTNWTEGDSIASLYGAHLVSISSEEENEFVSFFTNDNIWIGLNAIDGGDDLEWSSGESIDFTSWNALEPFGSGSVTIMYGNNDPINVNTSSNGNWALVSNISNPSNNLGCKTVMEFSDIPTWSTGQSAVEISVAPTTTTTYYSTFSNCTDSVVITVFDTSITTISATSCDSYEWNQMTYTESGIYTFTTSNIIGCDSLIQLDLTIHESDLDTISVSACNIYEWNNQTLTVSGFYTYSTSNIHGCDSTVILDLTINNDAFTESSEVACEEFIWDGDSYTENGSYTKTFTDINGCDSTHTISLVVFDSYETSDTISACDSYFWYDSLYSESGVYYHTVSSVNGCDSLLELNLTINQSNLDTVMVSTCNSYEWNNQLYTLSGMYEYSGLTTNGCDSTVILDLTIHYNDTTNSLEFACDEYIWDGDTYTQNGSYTKSFTNVNGCDSTHTITLIINDSFSSTDTVVNCYSYEWYDSSYTESGTYSKSFVTINGCDSLEYLNLTIIDSITINETITNCYSYTWNDSTYFESGVYELSTTSINGCDSTVILNLTISDTTYSTTDYESCFSYSWNGQTYTETGTYTFNTLSANGCDSIATLNLTLTDDPIEVSPILNGLEDVITGSVDNEYSVTNAVSGSMYHWSLSNDLGEISTSNSDSSVISLDFGNNEGMLDLCVYEENEDNCQSDVVCLRIDITQATSIIEQSEDKLHVYPNPLRNQAWITFSNPNNESITIKLIDTKGKTVRKYSNVEGNSLQLFKDKLSTGLYFVELQNSSQVLRSTLVIQ